MKHVLTTTEGSFSKESSYIKFKRHGFKSNMAYQPMLPYLISNLEFLMRNKMLTECYF